MDVKKQINNALETGQVILGGKKTISSILNSDPQLIILASNCPKKQTQSIKYYAALAGKKTITLKEKAAEIASSIGKPYPVSAMAVMDFGESTLLEARQ
jgi:large subunit ribosomal protein L30e